MTAKKHQRFMEQLGLTKRSATQQRSKLFQSFLNKHNSGQ